MAIFNGRLFIFDDNNIYKINKESLIIEDVFEGIDGFIELDDQAIPTNCIFDETDLIISDFGTGWEKNEKRFVHISSREIYGTARYIPMDESHHTTPQSTYAVSKLAGERVVFTMHKEHNLPAVIIRPFNSFGPNITQPYIIPEIIRQILKGDVVKLGNLNAKRDLTYVTDTARGIILSLVKEGIVGEVINIGSQRSYSIKELVSLISEIMRKEVTLEVDPLRFRPYDVDTLICDYERATKLLGWKPEITVREGLEKTIEWTKKEGVNIGIPFNERYEMEY